MINFIKKQFKKIIFFILGVSVCIAAPTLLPKNIEAEYITAPENNTYKIGQLNYNSHLEEDITSPQPLKYQLDDKFISFKPIEIRWDKKKFKELQSSSAKIDKKKYLYKDAFGKGIDIDMNFGERVWEKVVKINSLEDLGEIPKADYLEIVYEVETNFIIDGWNKKDDFEITEITRLGDFSYIELAMAWDSYSEKVCHIEYETYCDEGCIDDSLCDVCSSEEVCEIQTNKIQIRSFLSEDKGKLYLTKRIPVEWLEKAQYPVYTDTDVTYGTAQQFNGQTTRGIRLAELGTDKFVVCYDDYGGGSDGTCIVGTVSGTTMTFGTESDFCGDVEISIYDYSLPNVCKIGTDKFAVVYADDALGDDGYSRVVTVSGTTIGTWGTAKEFETGDTEAMDCDKLGTDKFVICYNDEGNSDTGQCVAATISGTTITTGTKVDYSATDHKPLTTSVCYLETDKFISCFYAGDLTAVRCYAGTVSGTTITMGAWNAINAASIYVDASSYETDKIILVYDDSNDVNARAITLSGTTQTEGAEVVLDLDSSDNVRTVMIDATHFVTVFQNLSATNQGESNYSSVDFSDRTIIAGTSEVFETNQIGHEQEMGLDIELISSNKIVICYQDDDTYDGGYCIIGDVAGAAAGTNMQINIGDAWKDVDSMKINIGDSWKDVAGAWINIGDSWKLIY